MEFLNHHQKMAERMLSPSQQQQQAQQMEAKRPRLDATSAVGGPQPQDGSPYVHLQHNFFPIDPSNSTIVISKSEYEAVKQEVRTFFSLKRIKSKFFTAFFHPLCLHVTPLIMHLPILHSIMPASPPSKVLTLKQTLSDFRGSMEAEMSQLKKENKSLKEHISKCQCGCKQPGNPAGHLNYNNTTTTNNNVVNNTDKSSEDENNSFGESLIHVVSAVVASHSFCCIFPEYPQQSRHSIIPPRPTTFHHPSVFYHTPP